ncbi:MAG: cysteine hydrolase family protein [Chloroflexota bacterium]|nr:MAG: cysteine hydrolase family protein [Chloroflexota bacterium]
MTKVQIHPELPLPAHFEPQKVGQVWRVPYEQLSASAHDWSKLYDLSPSAEDQFRIALVLVDVQNTFCIPGFELYVGGRSGTGAVDDNTRLVEFIYRNLGSISQVSLTMDTHLATQIFHPIFLVDENGEHPAPYTLVTAADIQSGRWRFNSILAADLDIDPSFGQSHLEYYTDQLAQRGKFDLTIWPYHAMLGGIGHALVPAVEEVVFFHTVARYSRPDFEVKGANPLTEHYSAIGPEVLSGPQGEKLGEKSEKLLKKVEEYDLVIIAGQAKSHCVAWTISDLLDQILASNRQLIERVYLLEDCTSSVVVPGVIDYTEQAEADFQRFAGAGMHLVQSTQPIASWPGLGG